MINFKHAKLMKQLLLGLFFLVTLFVANAYAQQTIGTVAKNITNSIMGLTKLVTAGAYVGGTTMFLIAIFQFRQHKENPTQVPLSKPMMFLAIAGALLFLPSLIAVTGSTIFGSNVQMGTATGVVPTK